jgi:histidyl-tRNA synthetase
MALSTQPYKGARDFYPEDKRLQNFIFSKLRETCERFGYEEYDAPVLEPTDLYLAKGNQEIIDEQTYTFKDRGDRSVTMRTEMTPTLSRMVAGRRQELAYPLRWFSIPNLWRYERPQKGRLREFWQLNADIFGVTGIEAELEIIILADELLKSLGAKPEMYDIKLNSRKLMDYVLGDYMGLDEVQRTSFSRLIDRMHKIDHAAFIAQADALCSPSQREQGAVEQLLDVLAAKRFGQLPQKLQQHESIAELQQLLERLEAGGITNVHFDPTLMRGFDYYTDIVFEVFDTDPDNNRSMFGGGRYDGLVGLFGVEPIATVGFGMGDAVLAEFLKGHGLMPAVPTKTDIYAVIVGDVLPRAQKPIQDLRGMGLNIAVDLSGRKIGDQFKIADKKGIEYALIIGENELNEEQYTLRNLHNGEEEKHGLERIVSIVLDHRHNPRRHDEELL